jgi:hypothetical protein
VLRGIAHRVTQPLAYLGNQDSNQTYDCDSMYHDENSSNGSTTYPLVGVPIDYPYGLTPAPLMDSAPAVCPASDVCRSFEQAQNWTTAPPSPTVTLSPHPIPRYREIRPRPPHESASTLPPVQPWQRGTAQPASEIGEKKHSKGHRQLVQGYLKKTARSAIRTVSEVTDTTKKQVRVGGMRYVRLGSPTGIPGNG